MAVGRDSKDLIGPLLAVNLVVYLIVLGLAGWSVDKYINGEQNHPRKYSWPLIWSWFPFEMPISTSLALAIVLFSDLGGNPATGFMLICALIGGVIGASSMLVGLVHLSAWRNDSLASASALAVTSWAVTALAFGFECKQIMLGGHRGKRLKTLEAMIIISLLSQFLYVVVLHAGVYKSRYGPDYRSCGSDSAGDIPVGREPEVSSTPTGTLT